MNWLMENLAWKAIGVAYMEMERCHSPCSEGSVGAGEDFISYISKQYSINFFGNEICM